MKPSEDESTGEVLAIRVWDPVVRIFHWALVACVVLNWAVLEEGERWHEWVGYAASALVVLRLIWGLIGTEHARFADWFPTPVRVREHLVALSRGERPRRIGHNPLGALMMLLLMALVLGLGLSGWLMESGVLDGPWRAGIELEELLEELHEGLANTLMLAAGLHAAAALIMGRLEGVNLVQAMVTGVKRFRRLAKQG